MAHRVTLKTISELLGVSQATVSKALRESTDISEDMKHKVKLLAENLGYQPNLFARGLVQKRSQLIGVIIPDINISYYADLVQQIYEAAHGIGYESVVMFHHEDSEREKKNLQFLVSLQVDGILISETPGSANTAALESIQNQGTPVIYYDRINPNAKVGFVSIDDAKAIRALMQAFYQQGRQKIGYIGATQGADIMVARYQNYIKVLAELKLAKNSDLIIECATDGSDALQKMQSRLNGSPDLDALICGGGLIAYYAGQAILDCGLAMPDDIILGEFGNNSIVQRLGISYYSIDQSPDLIARKSIELLQLFLTSQDAPWSPQQIYVESKLLYQDHTRHQERLVQIIN
jgi:LacI family transcriptional regulator